MSIKEGMLRGEYARAYNVNECENKEAAVMYLRATEQYANALLKTEGRLLLNDVYRLLGFPDSCIGGHVGWVYNEENPVGDNCVDFGLMPMRISGDLIWLDFNIDGII